MAATWACEVVASDIDPEAVRVTLENAQLNNLASQLLVFAGDGASALPQSHSGPFDIIVANILVGPLCQLAPSIARLLTEDGRVVLSGILISQIPQIAQAYRVVGLHIIEEVHHQEWAAVVVAPLSAATGSENV
jgi:ribosomal protein L11 methyltransferase